MLSGTTEEDALIQHGSDYLIWCKTLKLFELLSLTILWSWNGKYSKFATTRARAIIDSLQKFEFWNVTSLADNHRLTRVFVRDSQFETKFICVRVFGKCLCTEKSAVFLSPSSGCSDMYHHHHRSLTLVRYASYCVNLYMIIARVPGETHTEKTSTCERNIRHWTLVFLLRSSLNVIIKSHSFQSHIKVSVYCYLNGCRYMEWIFTVVVLSLQNGIKLEL